MDSFGGTKPYIEPIMPRAAGWLYTRIQSSTPDWHYSPIQDRQCRRGMITEALLGRGGLWIASLKSRIIHRSDRSSNFSASWRRNWWLLWWRAGYGTIEFGPSGGPSSLSSSCRLSNYAIYETVGFWEVEVHCTTQTALWFMHVSNILNFVTTLHKVYNAAFENPDTGTAIETTTPKVLPWGWLNQRSSLGGNHRYHPSLLVISLVMAKLGSVG